MNDSSTKYEVAEATAIFAQAAAPDAHRSESEQAARDLLRAVRLAAKSAGLNVLDNGTDEQLKVSSRDRAAWFTVDAGDGRPGIALAIGSSVSRHDYKPIEGIFFDPSTKIFVGVEEDTYRHGTPGEPRARRSAVSVAAHAIVAMLR